MHSFYECRSWKRKKHWQLNWIFTILGSARVKAEHKMFMKLIPESTNERNIISSWLYLTFLQNEQHFLCLIFCLPILFHCRITKSSNIYLYQWLPTGVLQFIRLSPGVLRHTRVPWECLKGTIKHYNSYIFFIYLTIMGC